MRWVIWLSIMLFAPVLSAAELRDLRLWDGPESTRVVFDLSDDVGHDVFTLSNPERVVIDLKGVPAQAVASVDRTQGKGLVKNVRSGVRGNGIRVVLDIADAVFTNSFELPPSDEYGRRLVVDLARPEAQTAASLPAPTTRLADKPIVVAVDAGHGGEDPGARGRSGLNEKDVALSVARKLAAKINATPNMKAVLTRDGDYYVGLRERVNIARKHQADLFISVHCNAFTKRDMHGTAVYVLSQRGATGEHARWLAHKENSADLVGGVDLHDKDNELAAVLIDLSQSATMEASFDVGSRILNSMSKINKLQKSELQQAGFAVLKAPDIPSVLVETAFITNGREEKLLASRSFQEKLAAQIFDGVRGYFHSYRPKQQLVLNAGDGRMVAGGENHFTQGVSQ
ncbi:MAG: N-acetylmuramoyl-L-alanine amidase [Nevskiales bacterium]|nr:N-acetylmuramoyl-L-alanine amidase [Nevskiales bacterium]